MQTKINPQKIILAYPKALKHRMEVHQLALDILEKKHIENYKKLWLEDYLSQTNSIFNILTCKLFCENIIDRHRELKNMSAIEFFGREETTIDLHDGDPELFYIQYNIIQMFKKTNKDYKTDINTIKKVYNSAYHSEPNEPIILNDEEMVLYEKHIENTSYR